jgi:hypothetical protein
MQRQSWSIGLACAIGALMGSLFGIEASTYLASTLKWWCAGAGMLVGSLIAYVAIDFRQFCVGVGRSYRETLAWRPDPLAWKSAWWTTYGFGTAMGTVCIYIVLAVAVFHPTAWLDALLTFGAMWVGIGAGTYLLLGLAGSFRSDTLEDKEKQLVKDRTATRKVIYYMNPLSAMYWAVWGLLQAASWIIFTAAPFIAVEGSRFLKLTFVYVHSTRRTICFVDAGLGALIGFTYGSPIIGAIAGALLGVLNYELVSVRLLKLTVRR